jgi:small subunit ribosomal protein S4e
MSKKGSSRHLKRHASPAFWPIHRKEYTWTVKPSPGPHPARYSIPLGIVIRDLFRYALTMKEAKKILSQGLVKIDNIVRRDHRFPVGFMDVLSLVSLNKHYRVIPHQNRIISLIEIPENEASYKLCRIENKTLVDNGNIQLNLHDGRTIELRSENASLFNLSKFDTVKISVPEGKLMDYVKLNSNPLVIVIGGKNIGLTGRLIELKTVRKRDLNIVLIQKLDGTVFQTILKYVFPIGNEKPLLTLPTL